MQASGRYRLASGEHLFAWGGLCTGHKTAHFAGRIPFLNILFANCYVFYAEMLMKFSGPSYPDKQQTQDRKGTPPLSEKYDDGDSSAERQ